MDFQGLISKKGRGADKVFSANKSHNRGKNLWIAGDLQAEKPGLETGSGLQINKGQAMQSIISHRVGDNRLDRGAGIKRQ